jgi:hypothetical protein
MILPQNSGSGGPFFRFGVALMRQGRIPTPTDIIQINLELPPNLRNPRIGAGVSGN